MKKIGIAVFALMFIAVSYVGAQNVKVAFDGEGSVQNSQNMEKFSMPEAFSDIEYIIPAPKREVKYDIENNTQSTYKSVTKEMLDNSIKSAIEDCKKNKFNILENNFKKLLKKGTLKEKYNFVYNNEKSYAFPMRIVKFNNEDIQRDFTKLSKSKVCLSYSTKEQCLNRYVCRAICTFVGGAVGGWAGCAIGYVSSEACAWVKECSPTKVCDEWIDDPFLNHGQDSNGNWRNKEINLGE